MADVRVPNVGDLPALVALGARFLAASHWDVKTDLADLEASLRALIEQDHTALFHTEGGMIGLGLSPLYFNRAVSVAVEIFFWAEDGKGDALRRAAERWAKAKGARSIHMGAHLPGPVDRLENLYRRAGYVPFGRSYSKGL